MEEDRMHKKIFTQELDGTRRRGRPRKGWKEEVERDLQVLGVRRWRELVADRKKMEGHWSTGQSPQWAVVPMEEEECNCNDTPPTPWGTVLEKLTGLQLVKKFPAFYETRRFISACARHLSPSWASTIQSIPPHPTSWRPILILSTNLRLGLPSGLSPSVICFCIPVVLYTQHRNNENLFSV